MAAKRPLEGYPHLDEPMRQRLLAFAIQHHGKGRNWLKKAAEAAIAAGFLPETTAKAEVVGASGMYFSQEPHMPRRRGEGFSILEMIRPLFHE